MIIKTQRLILRKVRKGDWKDLVEGMNDEGMQDNIPCVQKPYTRKDSYFCVNKVDKWLA